MSKMKITLKTILGTLTLFSLSVASPALAQSTTKEQDQATAREGKWKDTISKMTVEEAEDSLEFLNALVKEMDDNELRTKGKEAYGQRKFSNARSIFYKGAMNGDRKAQYHLAMMDEYGDDGTQNYKSALTWYKEAAYATRGTNEIDSPRAHFAQANLYFSGKGTEQDYRSAYWSYERAARGKHPEGTLNLGMMHYMGWGTKKNNESALFWFKKADALGAKGAKQALRMIGAE